MKTIPIALLGLALIASTAHSQTTAAPTPPAANAPTPDQMSARDPALRNGAAIGLTPLQVSSIDAILLDAWNTEQTIRANASITAAQQEEQTKANRHAARKEVHDVLTKPQRQQLRALLHGAPPAAPTPTP
jgi:hypothetical protein